MIQYTLPPGLQETTFGDGGHWVSRNGVPIRSVSKILNRIYPLPAGLDPWYLERGRLVHAATVLIDRGTLDWETLDERLKPFCSAYVAFRDASKVMAEAIELTVVHPSYAFGARLDRVYRFTEQGRPVVTDIKCGMGREDRYWLQVAACVSALDEAHVEDYDLALLNLDKYGRPHFEVTDSPGTWIERWRKVLAEDIS